LGNWARKNSILTRIMQNPLHYYFFVKLKLNPRITSMQSMRAGKMEMKGWRFYGAFREGSLLRE